MRLELYRCGGPDHWHVPGAPAWRWRIKATNGRILADSGEAYGRLRDCAHGAGLVTRLGDAIERSGGLKPGDRWTLTGEVYWRIVVDA